jgi:sugar O-acyltransferase (sialic acid O-acetyltransferase NeuD family)
MRIKKKKLILLGAGGHAKSLFNLISNSRDYKIIGAIENIKKDTFTAFKILGVYNDLNFFFKKGIKYALVATGQVKENKTRVKHFRLLKKIGFKIPTIISRHAVVGKFSKIGIGTCIFDNTYVGPNVTIGNNSIINTGAIIEHDSFIGHNCHISTGAIINGNVIVKDNTFIGSGSVIKEGTIIGENCIIGARSFVGKNIPNNKKVFNYSALTIKNKIK